MTSCYRLPATLNLWRTSILCHCPYIESPHSVFCCLALPPLSSSSIYVFFCSIFSYQIFNIKMGEEKPKSAGVWTSVKPFANGGASGMLATCVIQPVDMIKVPSFILFLRSFFISPVCFDYVRKIWIWVVGSSFINISGVLSFDSMIEGFDRYGLRWLVLHFLYFCRGVIFECSVDRGGTDLFIFNF